MKLKRRIMVRVIISLFMAVVYQSQEKTQAVLFVKILRRVLDINGARVIFVLLKSPVNINDQLQWQTTVIPLYPFWISRILII
jgi:hypothetical protein